MKKAIFLCLLVFIFIIFSCDTPVNQPGAITWTAVTSFSNGWNSDPANPLKYGSDSNGIVHLVGKVINPTSVLTGTHTIFTLPSGYLPNQITYTQISAMDSTPNPYSANAIVSTAGISIYPHSPATTALHFNDLTYYVVN